MPIFYYWDVYFEHAYFAIIAVYKDIPNCCIANSDVLLILC